MKRFFILLIVSAVFLVPMFASGNSTGDARISLVSGNVAIQGDDTDNQWQSVSINMPVMQDDTFWIPQDGKVEIQFYGSSYLRADQDTEFQVTAIDDSSKTITINVQSGRVYLDREGRSEGSIFQIDTSLVSVNADRSAKFDVNMRTDGVAEVSVISGSVSIDSGSGSTRINAGNLLAVSGSGTAEVSSYIPDDDWMNWNASQNYILEKESRSTAYLPPEISDYSYELDNNGNWTYLAGYGYVWSPVIVTPGWAPYSAGRWTWIHGSYVWVSYETWGWVPYHYGRWAFRPGFGWFWVPPVAQQAFWCPGYVAWIYTPAYVSWVPLAPGEVYYGYGYYGPHSVNLINVSINNVVITHAYLNAGVTNAVTSVSKETFASGSAYRKLKIPENPFINGRNVVVERPPQMQPTPARMITRPQGQARQFRQVTPPEMPNTQARVVTRQQDINTIAPTPQYQNRGFSSQAGSRTNDLQGFR